MKSKEMSIIPLEKPLIESRLELQKYLSDVQSDIKRSITSDFILAKLDDKQKEYIQETAVSAFFMQRIVLMLKKLGTKWKFENNNWIETELDEYDKMRMDEITKSLFEAFMNRITMITILNRNSDRNHLVNVLGGVINQEEKEAEEEKKQGRILENFKKIIKPEEKNV